MQVNGCDWPFPLSETFGDENSFHLSTKNYTHEVKMVLNSQLSTKNRNHLIKMVLKTGFSTKMNLPEH